MRTRFSNTRLATLLFFTLPITLIAFSSNSATGQNFNKVEQQLEKLVEKGHLEEHQAIEMLMTLREMVVEEWEEDWKSLESEHENDREEDRENTWIEDEDREEDEDNEGLESTMRHRFQEARRNAEREIRSALENGELTREEAHQKMKAFDKGIAKRMEALDRQRGRSVDDREAKYRLAEMTVIEMVKSGKITKQQAEERLSDLKKHLWGEDKEEEEEEIVERKMEDLKHSIRRSIQHDVEAGKLTRQEGRKRYQKAIEKMQERMDAHQQHEKENHDEHEDHDHEHEGDHDHEHDKDGDMRHDC